MGRAQQPPPVKLVAGLLATSTELLDEARAILTSRFGTIDARSVPTTWGHSDYYAAEMGPQLWRQFVAFAAPVSPGELAPIKQASNGLEEHWRGPCGRCVNIDPGILDLDKLVLASTKNAAHRIYLADGIYAEATLRFARGSFAPYAYTYPDYAAAETLAFFNQVRAALRRPRRV